MEIDPTAGPLAVTTDEDAILVKAAVQYFLEPSQELLADLCGHVSPGPDLETRMRRAALMIQASNAVLEQEWEVVSGQIAALGGAVACGPGCSACCNPAIPSHPFEAFLLGLHVAGSPELSALFARGYEDWDQRTGSMRRSFMDWAERCLKEKVDDQSHRMTDYYTPCPFLQDGLCQVYPARPYACRSYLAVAPECAAPKDPGQKPGFGGMDLGAYTPHRQAMLDLVSGLYKRFGLSPDRARLRLMPDLVHHFLAEGTEGLLRFAMRDDG